MEKERMVIYEVREKDCSGVMFSGKLEECTEFIGKQLRNRNKNDGYDEYWHNAKLVIIKKTILVEEFMYVD